MHSDSTPMDRLSFWSWSCTRRNAAQKRRGHWIVRAGSSSTSLTAITVPENLVSIGPRRFANSWHLCPLAEQYLPVHTVASRSGSANLSAEGARAALFRPYRARSRTRAIHGNGRQLRGCSADRKACPFCSPNSQRRLPMCAEVTIAQSGTLRQTAILLLS